MNKEMLTALKAMRDAYGRLHDMLSDAIEGGRLKESDIPDDYQALVEQLDPCSAADDLASKALMTNDTMRVEAGLEWLDYYGRELNRLEIPPNGDDWNELRNGMLSILQDGIVPSLILKAEGR